MASTAAILLAILWPGVAGLPPVGDWFDLSIFVIIGIAAEALALDFRFGPGRQARSSLAFLPFLALILVFDPFTAVTAIAVTIAFSQLIIRKSGLFRSVFNVSQGILASGLAALAYGGMAVPLKLGDEGIHLGAFFVLAFVFFSTNVGVTSCMLALLRHQPFKAVLEQAAGVRGANLSYDLLASPLAVITVALYSNYQAPGLLITVLPLMLVRYSYKSKVDLEEANRDLLTVLVKAIETRDPYTSGHSMRVARLAREIAADMGLRGRVVGQVETAALLHDIGKIDVAYEAVIQKPHDLDADEQDLIRTHAVRGAEMLENLSSVHKDVIRAVRHHHERYDGTGYPSGLHGTRIPVAARIIMLCDSIDAMLSDRPYRKALSIDATRKELIRCAGSQFDPAIVRVVLEHSTLERAAALNPRSEIGDSTPLASVGAM